MQTKVQGQDINITDIPATAADVIQIFTDTLGWSDEFQRNRLIQKATYDQKKALADHCLKVDGKDKDGKPKFKVKVANVTLATLLSFYGSGSGAIGAKKVQTVVDFIRSKFGVTFELPEKEVGKWAQTVEFDSEELEAVAEKLSAGYSKKLGTEVVVETLADAANFHDRMLEKAKREQEDDFS